ncbi:MAG: hypothetical protein H0X40_13615 [Chthoniobacterales bacterium]|nr:hypothetical protein [Chthoniobacterales bacterium]
MESRELLYLSLGRRGRVIKGCQLHPAVQGRAGNATAAEARSSETPP